ncbi:hypothetical protein BAE44_0012801 [Dichanthelium oligosanthes]|uniref:S-locus glycoprotein domain-containing protein n=1 Tax=Dichanthelium oligosanthes TaxID=888268 RepID=A0A1E5VM12_9POAL|nr:hypothetical protein BAE44_0012801 [Dichanthelium oligosanthes]
MEYQKVISPRETTYRYIVKPGAPFNYIVLMDNGVVKRLVWVASSRAWQTYYQGPRDVCDSYGKCGAFSLCNASAASTSFCACLNGFSPASPAAWNSRDTSAGCQRNVGAATDRFLLVQTVKLPDAHNVSVDRSITLEE